MSKLWKKHQKFLKGDAGFSLVELIIVIAIMAALIAILAPQYIKYVEKSRESKDISALDEILRAAQVSVVDPSVDVSSIDDITVTCGSEGAVVTGGTVSVLKAMADIVGQTYDATTESFTVPLSSTKGKALGELTIEVDITNSGVKWADAPSIT